MGEKSFVRKLYVDTSALGGVNGNGSLLSNKIVNNGRLSFCLDLFQGRAGMIFSAPLVAKEINKNLRAFDGWRRNSGIKSSLDGALIRDLNNDIYEKYYQVCSILKEGRVAGSGSFGLRVRDCCTFLFSLYRQLSAPDRQLVSRALFGGDNTELFSSDYLMQDAYAHGVYRLGLENCSIFDGNDLEVDELDFRRV